MLKNLAPMGDTDLASGKDSIIAVPGAPNSARDDALRQTKILIIDDELPNVQLLERILKRERFLNFISTTDSRVAVSLFQEFRPDLVLLDWLMPHLSGRAVIEQLRVLSTGEEYLPIVVLTADVTPEAKRLALASGATEFITKPFDAIEVVLRIVNLLQTRLAHLRMYEQKVALEEIVRQRTLKLEQAVAELRASQHQLIQAERLSALGTMASGIAHDFNNALTLIIGFGEILLRDAERGRLTKENTIPSLKDVLAAARDAASTVRQLREFSRFGDTGDVHKAVSLNKVIEQAVSFTKPKWETQSFAEGTQISAHVDCGDIPAILGDAAQLRDVVINLIFNAADAMPQGGTITLRTQPEPKAVLLQVSDTGTGMTEEVRRRCLEPFFTTKGDQGSGLGLAMVFSIVQRHSGTIDIASEPGKGTTFTLRLPTA
jgi:signal transduction histidine kinase